MGVLTSKELVPRRPNPVEGRTEYKISIETGDLKGTKKIAVLVLYGTKGVTDEIEVDPRSGKFHKGSSEFFKTIQTDLGELWRIDLWLRDQSKTNEWYVNLIDVRQGDKLWTFPIYRWIDEREEVRAGKALLPQHEKSIECLQHRNEELEKKKGVYQFNQPVGDKLPSILKSKYEHLPTDEKFSPEKSEDFISARNRVAKDLIIDKFFHSFTPLNDFEDYEVLFTTIAKPRLHRTWRTDREFGWQRVKGASCTHIYKISKIPSKFGVTDEMVAKFLPPGSSLTKEAEQGKLFFLDFAVLEDVPVQSGRYICAPMCLLHLNHEGDLLPIAIQLHQKPDPVSNPIWTPADSEPDWLLAKMWVALADVNVYQTSSHYTKTHLVMETVNVAVNRNFSLVHPIFKLLHPHFRFHLAINALARQSLIVPTGILVEAGPMKFSGLAAVIERTYKDWHWKQNSFPGMMKLRGFAPDGSDAPKCYYYAHDGYLLWNAIKDFTKEIIHIYYLGDSDTISDSELQSFATELHIAFGPGKGFPSKITSRDDLVEILASIIFQVSVQHAVLNFSQFESFAFVPFTPGAIMMPPPGANGTKVVKGVATLQDIFKSMPSKAIAARQLAVLYLLSQYSSTDHMLGNFPEELFTEDKPKAAIANFQARLAEISAKIKSRGDWTNMSPEKIPNSTSI